MRLQPRSEDRRRSSSSSSSVKPSSALTAEIGSRVLPFRPPPAPMPTVGARARRSTRVFVPKSAVKPRDAAPSAKRLALPKCRSDDWLHVFGPPTNGSDTDTTNGWWNEDGKKMEELNVGVVEWNEHEQHENNTTILPETSVNGIKEPKQLHENRERVISSPKRFEIFYRRKRRRSQAPGELSSLKDLKYGMVYLRKRKKPKVESLAQSSAEQVPGENLMENVVTEASTEEGNGVQRHEDEATIMVITDSTWNIAYGTAGILRDDIDISLGGSVMLAVFIESTRSSGSCLFPRILVSIMKSMEQRGLNFLCVLKTLLFSGSLAAVFSSHGIHFLPIQRQKMTVLSRNTVVGCGLCKLYGAAERFPLITIDFLSVPLYFKSLHASLFLASEYLPAVFARNLTTFIQSEGYDSHIPAGAICSRNETEEITVSETSMPSMIETSELFTQNTAVVPAQSTHNSQKKRCTLRPSLDRNRIIVSLPATLRSLHNSSVEPAYLKSFDEPFADVVNVRVEDDASTPFGPPQKCKKTEVTKEQRLALAELKQNIDSVRCPANILVIDSDKCWREEGAEITLLISDSEQWCIAAKVDCTVRYLHKPQELRPCNINRYTRAYMWVPEDNWRLEFSDRWDWLVFKELHTECCERNKHDVPVKIIPVPGIHEVFQYDEVTSSFMRPNRYIHTRNSEVERALASSTANYDMDSDDEEWVKQLNSSSLSSEHANLEHISNDNFEKMIFAFEKDAFINPDDISIKERASVHCQDFGKTELVASVFDYWLKKRNKKCASLVRVFQFPPAKKLQFMNNSFLRKKRSFNRRRSQGGRGRPESFLQGGAKRQEAMQKVNQAETLAGEALQKAINLRTRAQTYMSNAELAAYKSVMALRIAEAKKITGSQDFVSSILD